jgi:predicted transcriptional regulator
VAFRRSKLAFLRSNSVPHSIWSIRKRLDLSQSDLCKMFQWRSPDLSRYEAGTTTPDFPRLLALLKIAATEQEQKPLRDAILATLSNNKLCADDLVSITEKLSLKTVLRESKGGRNVSC